MFQRENDLDRRVIASLMMDMHATTGTDKQKVHNKQ